MAHAFIYFNVMYNSDSMMIAGSGDAVWQISLGRYLQWVYYAFRGPIQAPWLIGALQLLYLSGAIFLIVLIFRISSKRMIIALCAVLSTYVSLTCSNATYLPWADTYMLALLLASLGAFFVFSNVGGRIWSIALGAASVSLAMGLYQSYLAAFVVISMAYTLYVLSTAAIGKRPFVGRCARCWLRYWAGYYISAGFTPCCPPRAVLWWIPITA